MKIVKPFWWAAKEQSSGLSALVLIHQHDHRSIFNICTSRGIKYILFKKKFASVLALFIALMFITVLAVLYNTYINEQNILVQGLFFFILSHFQFISLFWVTSSSFPLLMYTSANLYAFNQHPTVLYIFLKLNGTFLPKPWLILGFYPKFNIYCTVCQASCVVHWTNHDKMASGRILHDVYFSIYLLTVNVSFLCENFWDASWDAWVFWIFQQ